MGLPENFSYSDAKSSLGSMGKSIQAATRRFAESAPKPSKAVDTSQYDGLRQRVTSHQNMVPNNYNLGTVTSTYNDPTRKTPHYAVDVANKMGSPIPSFTQGTVTDVFTGGQPQSGKGYGNYIIVTDPQGNRHRYSHLNKSYVKVGQPVTRGMVLGGMGNTGASFSNHGGDGTHLDYRVRNIYDQYIRPERFMRGGR